MPRIDLELNTDLMVTDDGYVTLRISPDEGNSLSIESDGLMSVGSLSVNGWNSKSGQILDGLTIGQVSIYNKTESKPVGRISTTGIVHRIFTSHGDKPGEELTGRMTHDHFRSDLDYCLPGDIFRIRIDNNDNYDYYLILKVDPRKEGNKYEPGNMIARYVKLGTWGDLSEKPEEYTPPETTVPTTEDTSLPTTIGGSDVVIYEDLEHVNVGDRVIVNPYKLNWLPFSDGTEREISDYEFECIWHVQEKIPSELNTDVKRIRTSNKMEFNGETNFRLNMNNTNIQFKVFAYTNDDNETFLPEESKLTWMHVNNVNEPFSFTTDVKCRLVFRNNDNSAINETLLAGMNISGSSTGGIGMYIHSDITSYHFEQGDIDDTTGEDVNGTLGDESNTILPASHYMPLRYKPNSWNITYSTYYEYRSAHYQKIPDDTATVPDFNARAYFKKTTGYECVIDEPARWSAPYEYQNYYQREYHTEPIIKYGLSNINFEQGMINDLTGEQEASTKHIRSVFTEVLPTGKYRFYTENWLDRETDHPVAVQVNVYVYKASDNTYVSSQSSRSWNNFTVTNLELAQDSKVCIVIRSADERNIDPTIMIETFYIQKYPTTDASTTTEDGNGNYVSYTYNQLTSPTTFVSGEFYRQADVYIQLLDKPAGWDSGGYLDYYTLEGGEYICVPQSSTVPEFVIGKYYELIFDDIAGSDKLVFEGGRSLYLRDVYRAPNLSASDLQKDTLVRLSNAEFWNKDIPCWSYSESIEHRNISSRVNPPDMSYELGSLDVFTGINVDSLGDRARTTGYVLLSEDGNTSTASDTFTLNADGATKVVMFVYTKSGDVYQYNQSKSITDWRDLPFQFQGFSNGSTYVRFVFRNDSDTFNISELTNITLKTNDKTVITSDPYTTEEMFSIWYINNDTVDPTMERVDIARKRSATTEEIIRENVPIKCLDLYTEVASIVELHVGEAVTIADNAETWLDGDVITEEESKYYTYIITKRDLQTEIFTLNNGKRIYRKYLNKISRVSFNPELTEINMNVIKPNESHDVTADEFDTNEGNGG